MCTAGTDVTAQRGKHVNAILTCLSLQRLPSATRVGGQEKDGLFVITKERVPSLENFPHNQPQQKNLARMYWNPAPPEQGRVYQSTTTAFWLTLYRASKKYMFEFLYYKRQERGDGGQAVLELWGTEQQRNIILTLRSTEIPTGEKEHIPTIPKGVHHRKSR